MVVGVMVTDRVTTKAFGTVGLAVSWCQLPDKREFWQAVMSMGGGQRVFRYAHLNSERTSAT